MNSFMKTFASAAVFGALALGGSLAYADALDDIKAAGVLKVGVKADYKPYGFRDPSGAIVGIEPELAKDVADRLGVKVEYIPVVSSNRMQFLEQGKVDLMIATMTDKPDRRKVVSIVDPNYYSSGTNVLALAKYGLKEWEDLRGKPVCGIQGAFYNKKTAKDYGAKIVAFKGTSEAYAALKGGNCVAFVYDDSAIVAKTKDPEWEGYEMPLQTIDDAPWGLAVQLGETKFHELMSDQIVSWHKSGRILELETKWGVENTPFAKAMNKKYAAAEADSGVIATIKERGTLKVGVKADYKPYGFRDPSGAIVGIEPELAKDVADRLGVKVEYIPVVSSNRMQFLEQGKVDLMIATMTDKPDRRKVVSIVDPNYYSSGTNVLALAKYGLKEWEDLRGKPVCGIQGAFYNKKTAKDYGAKIVAFKGTSEAYAALKGGNCVAFVYDDSAIVAKTKDPEWEGYEMPLKTIDDAPWGLAVQLGETAFHELMSDQIKSWHKTGRILELETKWGVENTPFAIGMNKKYQ
jgi:polar amino acid transport system substrate-binding protein